MVKATSPALASSLGPDTLSFCNSNTSLHNLSTLRMRCKVEEESLLWPSPGKQKTAGRRGSETPQSVSGCPGIFGIICVSPTPLRSAPKNTKTTSWVRLVPGHYPRCLCLVVLISLLAITHARAHTHTHTHRDRQTHCLQAAIKKMMKSNVHRRALEPGARDVAL